MGVRAGRPSTQFFRAAYVEHNENNITVKPWAGDANKAASKSEPQFRREVSNFTATHTVLHGAFPLSDPPAKWRGARIDACCGRGALLYIISKSHQIWLSENIFTLEGAIPL